MSNRFIDQAAPGLAALKPYVPGRPLSELEREFGITDSIKLASNENPLGPSPHAVEAIQAQLGDLTRYPRLPSIRSAAWPSAPSSPSRLPLSTDTISL